MLVRDIEDRMTVTEFMDWITYYESKSNDAPDKPKELATMDSDAIGALING